MASPSKPNATPFAESAGVNLCLTCGLCCDGTLFKDVELHADDQSARDAMTSLLVERGKPARAPKDSLEVARSKSKWPQPCAALCPDLRCQIYRERPSRCRDFECLLLKAVNSGSRKQDQAQKVIVETRRAAERVRWLLHKLGDQDERQPLSRRFNRMRRRLDAGGLCVLSEDETQLYADLTLAVHQLQSLLRREFYP
jgi:Fe-S-cluster containining protein